MADFSIRADSVDVEQIMQQIRSRVREKRGVDYTEDEVRALATVRLEKFLDPKNLRSDLLEQFRKSRPPLPTMETVELPYTFDDQTLFATHRGPLQFIRKLLRPILKLFFNPNTLNQILHLQSRFNGELLVARAEWNVLYYEVLHNLVLETTRTNIEVKNLKMRVEALSSRLEFSERRVRALEGVVQYRPEVLGGRQAGAIADGDGEATSDEAAGEGPARRRRRRRRGRRSGGGAEGGDATEAPGSTEAGEGGTDTAAAAREPDVTSERETPGTDDTPRDRVAPAPATPDDRAERAPEDRGADAPADAPEPRPRDIDEQ